MEKQLRGARVVVTGGAGFIGSHIVERLVAVGAQVTVVDNLVCGKKENLASVWDKIRFLQEDFASDSCLRKALAGADYVSHQAALRSVPKSVESPVEYHSVNVTGTLKLFLAAREQGIKRIVFASSSSVYGERSDFPERESDYPRPISPYAATKLMAETYAYMFSHLYGLSVVCLRYFNVFGPRQSLENQYAVVIPKFITCLLRDEPPPVYGDGGQERDFTYIDNVVEANLLALVTAGIEGQVFNVASGSPQSVNNLLKLLEEITGKRIQPLSLAERAGDVRKTEADIAQAGRLLGWKPRVDFNEGLKKTVDWFRKNLPE